MEILEQPPVIFTKDKYWVDDYADKITLEPGSIILLPDDAVLLVKPITIASPIQLDKLREKK